MSAHDLATPVCDEWESRYGRARHWTEFARKLERELAAANAKLAMTQPERRNGERRIDKRSLMMGQRVGSDRRKEPAAQQNLLKERLNGRTNKVGEDCSSSIMQDENPFIQKEPAEQMRVEPLRLYQGPCVHCGREFVDGKLICRKEHDPSRAPDYPLPPGYTSHDELIAESEADPKRKAALDRARDRLRVSAAPDAVALQRELARYESASAELPPEPAFVIGGGFVVPNAYRDYAIKLRDYATSAIAENRELRERLAKLESKKA